MAQGAQQISTGNGPYSTLNNNAGTGGTAYGRSGMNASAPETPPPLGVTPGTQAYQIWQMTGQTPAMPTGGGIAGGLPQNGGIAGGVPGIPTTSGGLGGSFPGQNTGPAGPGSPVNFGGPNYHPPGNTGGIGSIGGMGGAAPMPQYGGFNFQHPAWAPRMMGPMQSFNPPQRPMPYMPMRGGPWR